ncbi:MAG: methyltransferase domain-containing protein, partial [Planctomycetes bacterium]|nr:methyltransferase domain-containing protein [Planctomycetota bacterium]
DWFFNGGSHECGMYDLYDGSPVTKTAATVLTEEVVYQMSGGSIQALDLAGANPTLGSIWSLPIGAQQVYCKAGSVLYAGSTDHVYAVEDLGNSGQLLWDKTITGNPTNMLAADNKLFVVTEEGYLYCFGESDTGVSLPAPGSQAIAWPKRDEWTIKARAILDCADANEGYCLVAGVGTGRLTEELVRQSDMKVIALDPDTAKVDTLRKRWQQMGLTGERVSVLTGDIFSVDLPAYLANLIVSEDLVAAGIDDPNEFIEKVFYSLRPYGGQVCFHPGFQAGDFDYNGLIDSGDLSRLARLWLKEGTSLIADHYPDRIIDEKDFAIMVKYWLRDFSSSSLQGIFEQAISHAGLANAEVTQAYEYTLLERVGPLPGSADWSHMYADASNTIVSRDALVKLPLGLLWFGGSSNTEMLPRHGHGPSEQVVAGRIFIEGPDVLRAMDVYTGRVMWERSLPNFGAHYNNTEHMPGAMALGTNYVSAEDAVYVAYGTQCLRLAPDNGATTATFTIADPGYEDAVFGQVSIWDDLLIVGADPIVYPGTPGQENWNESCSRDIVVMNRYTGNIVWQKRANHSFQHNSIIVGNDTLYCIDRIPPNELDALSRRGIDPNNPTALWKLLALDVATGSEIWSTTDNVFGTWLGYSEEYDVLLQSGRKSRDSHDDEPTGRLITYDGSSGTVLWDKSSGVSDGPYLLHHDTIIMQGTNAGSALSLLTGDVIMRDHPITGGSTPWSFSRNYGCNTAVGSEYLLTYRSGAAGYYDLSNNGGTGNLGGFKSSCTSNLIPANGVLNVPDYTRTCTCSYQNQTSLALIHMPETEVWTFDPVSSSSGPVEKIGINFAAPGDRL